jgi:hypothetical protein
MMSKTIMTDDNQDSVEFSHKKQHKRPLLRKYILFEMIRITYKNKDGFRMLKLVNIKDEGHFHEENRL